MKRILVVVMVLMALISFGSAAGNDFSFGSGITQTNWASASSNYQPGVYEQYQSNMAVVVGNGNHVTQSNSADATNHGFGSIFQSQSNLLIAVGDGNDVFQRNLADADNFGGKIKQIQKNLAVVVGSENDVGQVNRADAHAGTRASIEQDQTNLGVVVGNNNGLFQKNRADADAFGPGDKIDQSQTNLAVEIGEKRGRDSNHLSQENTAYADAYAVSTVNQVEKNLAVVVGSKEDVHQSNWQDADPSMGSAKINQNAVNSLVAVGHFDRATQSNDQDAYGVIVDQAASNLGVLVSGNSQLP